MDTSPRRLAFCAALVLVVACATAAIVATYSELSHTWDEGTHVAAGLELLQEGHYTFQTENPPLSRVALALIPYFRGARLPPAPRGDGAGVASDWVFYRSPDYVSNVTEARLATLGFFWACVALTWVLAGGRSDPWVALLASAAVATLPPIVAHAGLATTDVAFVASMLLALTALRRLLREASRASAALAGAALGIAIATKFSTFVFLPPVVAAVLAVRYWDDRARWVAMLIDRSFWRTTTVVAGTAMLVVWASYACGVGRLDALPSRFAIYGAFPTTGWAAAIKSWTLPGHEFIHGLLFLQAHTIAGHRSTLFDAFSQRGFLLYYPVVLATKTPTPFILFAAAGIAALFGPRHETRSRWCVGLALGALGVLLVAMSSPINLGVRHVLVIYPLVAVSAAFGIVRVAERSPRRPQILTAAAGCLGLQLVLLMWSVPHQLTYFNVFAGSDPAYVSSDSDFDWGQHGIALERYFAEHPVPELYVLLNGSAQHCRLKLPPLKTLPAHPVTGWIAVSERQFRLNQGTVRANPCDVPGRAAKTFIAQPGWLDWLKAHEPVAIIGRTVRLYHITEPQ